MLRGLAYGSLARENMNFFFMFYVRPANFQKQLSAFLSCSRR